MDEDELREQLNKREHSNTILRTELHVARAALAAAEKLLHDNAVACTRLVDERDQLRAALAAERENADRLAKALQIAVDELSGQLHGPVSAVFEGAFDALQQHEARRGQP